MTERDMSEEDGGRARTVERIKAAAVRRAAQIEPYPDVPLYGPDLQRQLERQLFDDGDP